MSTPREVPVWASDAMKPSNFVTGELNYSGKQSLISVISRGLRRQRSEQTRSNLPIDNCHGSCWGRALRAVDGRCVSPVPNHTSPLEVSKADSSKRKYEADSLRLLISDEKSCVCVSVCLRVCVAGCRCVCVAGCLWVTLCVWCLCVTRCVCVCIRGCTLRGGTCPVFEDDVFTGTTEVGNFWT